MRLLGLDLAARLDAAHPPSHRFGMLIYKILTVQQWADLNAAGATLGAPVDREDGFIHFSTAAQAAGTAAKHFAGCGDLVLVAVEAAALGDALRWEPAREGALFPHLYVPLRRETALWAHPLPLGPDGVHVFPKAMA